MEHFIRVVMEKQDTLAEGLNDDVFPGSEVMETEQGATVFHIPLPNALSEQESDEFADRLVNYMTEQGYDDFDIECSMDSKCCHLCRNRCTQEGLEFPRHVPTAGTTSERAVALALGCRNQQPELATRCLKFRDPSV